MPTIVDEKINTDPHLKKLYAALLKAMRVVGKVTVEVKKTSVHVKAKSAFAGIHARKDHLIVQIVTEAPIESPRVFKVEKISSNRVHNHVRIQSVKDIDLELGKWLARGYALMG
jgi:hypothetical protein